MSKRFLPQKKIKVTILPYKPSNSLNHSTKKEKSPVWYMSKERSTYSRVPATGRNKQIKALDDNTSQLSLAIGNPTFTIPIYITLQGIENK